MDSLLLQTPAQLTQHIKSLRKSRGLTQAQAAARLGVKQARYAAIENHPDSISTAQLLDLFAVLGVDVLLRPKKPRHRASHSGEEW